MDASDPFSTCQEVNVITLGKDPGRCLVVAESKRTGTSGNTIINNNNVVGGSGGGRGGSGGTGIMPFPVKDNTIPNFTFPI